MAFERSHKLHKGELAIQKKRYVPEHMPDMVPQFIQTQLPAQHADFYAQLSYIAVGTLDKSGRPWVTLLVTESDLDSSIGINISNCGNLLITAEVGGDDPFRRALDETKFAEPNRKSLFAGVGIDFTNRRRNKIAGTIELTEKLDSGKLHLDLNGDEHLGNCPKYITVRELIPRARTSETVFNNFESLDTQLPQYCKDHINKVSTVYLATKHIADNAYDENDHSDMGLNHRGGTKGFLRLYEEETNQKIETFLVLPDYSGNRFYQSLGNIECDEFVGLALPDFATGDMLYVTGEAKNIFDEEAQQLMPRASLITRIKITGAVFIKQAIDLKLSSSEEFSPYNPPLRYLSNELELLGHGGQAKNLQLDRKATLVEVKNVTSNISTFTFKLDRHLQTPMPGGFCVLNFSGLLNEGYRHMDEDNPQLVNEDYLRTWTISSAPTYSPQQIKFSSIDHFDVTVRNQSGGLISSFLHQQGKYFSKSDRHTVEVTVNGTGGQFSCFRSDNDGVLNIPLNMVWIAGGVGVTPFMSMWDGIKELSKYQKDLSTNVVLVFSGREGDVNLLKHFLDHYQPASRSISMKIIAFLTQDSNSQSDQIIRNFKKENVDESDLQIHSRRLTSEDISGIEHLSDCDIFQCGPERLTKSSNEWLLAAGVDMTKVHEESFYF